MVRKLTILALLLALAPSCALLRATKPTKLVTMTAEQCVAIARAYCRPDIAEACQVAKDLAPLFEQLLGESGNLGAQQCRQSHGK